MYLAIIVVCFINSHILTTQMSPCLFTKKKIFLFTTIILEFCALFWNSLIYVVRVSALSGWRNGLTGSQFNKGKCKILHWGRNDPRHQYVQRPAQLESSLTEKALGVLVDTQLTMSQHCAPAARKAGVILPGLHEEEPLPAGEGRWSFL